MTNATNKMRYPKTALAAIVLLGRTLCAFAGSFTLSTSVNNASFDWREGSNYEGGVAPQGAGDSVVIPAGVTAKIAAGDAGWNLVSSLDRIRPAAADSYFQVEVASGTAELACEITLTGSNTSESRDRGGLVKTGVGTLQLTSGGDYSYFTSIDVAEGTLEMPSEAVHEKCYIDLLTVRAGATFRTYGGSAYTVCRAFFGAGTIDGAGTGRLQTLTSSNPKSVFSGVFTGFEDATYVLAACSPVDLTGSGTQLANKRFLAIGTADYENGPALGLACLGLKDSVSSSVGTGKTRSIEVGVYGGNGGGVRYLGAGDETTDVSFDCRGNNSTSGIFIDGGVNGGLTLRGGSVSCGAKSSAVYRQIFLTGDHPVPCVFADALTERWDKNGMYCPYHLVKRGAGIWQIEESAGSMFSGGVSVERGTLRVASLAPAGTFCSLGFATNLYDSFTGSVSDDLRVNWAIALGTPTTTGTLEYVGTEDVACATRPILMKGDGGLANATDNSFRFEGVRTGATTPATLTLGGSGSGVLNDVSDSGTAALSIAKTGTGEWTLSTNVTFRGALDIQEGRLTVNAGAHYTWFRFTVIENYSDDALAADAIFCVRKLAFFDKDGIDQTVGLAYNADKSTLQPGQFAYGGEYVTKDSKTYPYTESYPWERLFEDADNYPQVTLAAAPTSEDESTHFPLIIRLPEGANPVTAFDICYNTSKTGNGRVKQPAAFTLEGSTDGVSWAPILSKSGIVSPGSGHWLQSDKVLANTLPLASTAYAGGETVGAPAARANLPLAANRVRVVAGAELIVASGRATVSSLVVDAETGLGTLDGIDFAAQGTVEVVGDLPASRQIPAATLVRCTGFSNVSNWTVTRHEAVSLMRLVTTDSGEIAIRPSGLILLVK